MKSLNSWNLWNLSIESYSLLWYYFSELNDRLRWTWNKRWTLSWLPRVKTRIELCQNFYRYDLYQIDNLKGYCRQIDCKLRHQSSLFIIAPFLTIIQRHPLKGCLEAEKFLPERPFCAWLHCSDGEIVLGYIIHLSNLLNSDIFWNMNETARFNK